MRYNVTKRNSTKSERKFYEFLKESGVPFKHRWIIHGREVDFVVGTYAIEINGHAQDTVKTLILHAAGYNPVHLPNEYVSEENKHKIIQWLRQIQSSPME